MIYGYSHNVTNRLKYTSEVLFRYILKVDIQWVEREEFVRLENVPKLNYSSEAIVDSIWISPHSLLFETNIKPQEIAVSHLEGIPYFFKTASKSDIQYDLLASTFYLISRYEEYLPFKADAYGRFSAKESLAYKANFLHLPVVHYWANALKIKIQEQYPDFTFPSGEYKQLNTIDIDVAYAYRGKPFWRHLGGIFKSIVQLNIRELIPRFRYYITQKDPYDTYDYILQFSKDKKIEPIFFIQMGKYGTFDKNIPLKKPLKSLIERLSKIGKIGIHPSYQSNADSSELKWEIQNLEGVLKQKVSKSRQHFLKLSFPETYEKLIANGIEEDYTLGYADQTGFRAGICTSYPFFNLQLDEIRPLLLTPFQIMDGTLKDYLHLTPEEAILRINETKKIVQEVNGTFVSIFHNSSLTNSAEWEGWQKIYEEM